MLRLNTETLANAIKKARKIKNHVRMIAFREYAVTTPENHSYRVRFEVQNGKRYGSCSCASRVVCYHLAAALPLHLHVAKQRMEATKAATAASAKPACDCWACQTGSRYGCLKLAASDPAYFQAVVESQNYIC